MNAWSLSLSQTVMIVTVVLAVALTGLTTTLTDHQTRGVISTLWLGAVVSAIPFVSTTLVSAVGLVVLALLPWLGSLLPQR